jgi:HEAT repeat protein
VFSALQAALHDDNPHVRSHATDILRLVDGVTKQQSSLSPTLGQQVAREQDSDEVYEATAAFKQAVVSDAQHPKEALAFIQVLHSKDSGVRREGIRALGRGKDLMTQHPPILSSLVEVALHDSDAGVRTEAVAALGQVDAATTQRTSVLFTLGRLVLRDMDAGVRARAAQALGQIGDKAAWQPEVLSALVQALRDADADVRFRAAEALGQMMAQGVRVFRRRWGKIEGKRVDDLATLRE